MRVTVHRRHLLISMEVMEDMSQLPISALKSYALPNTIQIHPTPNPYKQDKMTFSAAPHARLTRGERQRGQRVQVQHQVQRAGKQHGATRIEVIVVVNGTRLKKKAGNPIHNVENIPYHTLTVSHRSARRHVPASNIRVELGRMPEHCTDPTHHNPYMEEKRQISRSITQEWQEVACNKDHQSVGVSTVRTSIMNGTSKNMSSYDAMRAIIVNKRYLL
jgi:hypothetical protein